MRADWCVVLDVLSSSCALVSPKGGVCEKGVMGGGLLVCHYRAECMTMDAGLNRLAEEIELDEAQRARVMDFTDSMPLPVVLAAFRAAADAILRGIWILILCIVRLHVPVDVQFMFSNCCAAHNATAGAAAEWGNTRP
ncbi:hypothetical protein ERJ75_000186600 [Trypanosoma vivax]|nr:hypothetical protein ERJ75_000186600 [Trypanosoma vivax]